MLVVSGGIDSPPISPASRQATYFSSVKACCGGNPRAKLAGDRRGAGGECRDDGTCQICGVTRIEDAEAAIAAGADDWPEFPPPQPAVRGHGAARLIRDAIGSLAEVIGVFVNTDRAAIDECRRALRLDMLQFHGDEDEDALAGWPVPVVRAIRVRGGEAARAIVAARADYVLLDTFHPSLYGGSGLARPIDDLKNIDLSRVFVSGGLNPANVARAAGLRPYAVDVASGVESSPGVKDHFHVRSFVGNAKSAR